MAPGQMQWANARVCRLPGPPTLRSCRGRGRDSAGRCSYVIVTDVKGESRGLSVGKDSVPVWVTEVEAVSLTDLQENVHRR